MTRDNIYEIAANAMNGKSIGNFHIFMTVPQYIDQSPWCLPAGHLAEISMVSPEFGEGSKSTWEPT